MAERLINQALRCRLPCSDVNRDPIIANPDLDPEKIRIVLISEAAPALHSSYYYQDPSGAFFQATQAAFRDAGMAIDAYEDITKLGIYLTTAIKCCKKGYAVSGDTIRSCSYLLEEEISQFPHVGLILCMGDVAIKAVNQIARRKHKRNAIPAGATYKNRTQEHLLQGIRYLPSYTQTGESSNIEQSKRRMIAEDIRGAMRLLQGG